METPETWDAWTEYNLTDLTYPDVGGLVAWIAAAVADHPERPAVRTAERTLSYRELSSWSDRIANHLVGANIPAGSIVAVTSSRTVEPYAAILGILKAGCGYVPIDPNDPPERLRFILDDAGATMILARAAEAEALNWTGDDDPPLAWIDELPPAPQASRLATPDPDRIGYIIYTSGTTGRPKGVRIRESSILNFTHWCVTVHDIGADDVVAQVASLTFDPSVQQIFAAWVTGACLAPVPLRELYDPFALMRWLAEERVTVVDVVTGQWHTWREAAEQDETLRALPDLRWIIVGGETAYHHESWQWHRMISSPAVLRNIYGPTEATINASETLVDPGVREGQISIGVPLPNYRLYVVDGEGRLCGTGVTGELVIAGAGIADGYQSKEATARAFGDLVLPDGRTERVYRSGDLSKLIRDGDGRLVLEFVGRIDTQVKIRGFRIELEEVEAAAKKVSGVRAAAVQLRNDTSEQIACFYIADAEADEEYLRACVSRSLAAHQVPNLFLRMPQFPLTSNGKLDRRALGVELERALRRRAPVGAVPVSATEQLIANVWSNILDIGQVAADENFFALGGTSLLAVSAVRALRESDLSVLPTDLFAHPTVRGLASWLSGRSGNV